MGTDGYQAPEILGLVKRGKGEYYDSKCDIWSFACLYHQLSFGILPFSDLLTLTSFCDKASHSYSKVVAQYLMGSHPDTRHSFVKKYLLALLEPNPQQRPTAVDAFVRLEQSLGLYLSVRSGAALSA